MGNAFCGCRSKDENPSEFNFNKKQLKTIENIINVSENDEDQDILNSVSASRTRIPTHENKKYYIFILKVIAIQRQIKKFLIKIRQDLEKPSYKLETNKELIENLLLSKIEVEESKNSKSFINISIAKKLEFLGDTINNKKEGFGILNLDEKTKYIGNFKLDKAEGIGKLRRKKDFYYKGEFKTDKANGYGLFVGSTGEEYQGEWENDTQNGIGREVLQNSHIYEGQFVNGKKSGLGTYLWSNGSKYEGEWEENNIHGYGIYYFKDVKIYKGQFKNNMMNGYGEFYWRDGKKYFGYYVNDKKDGFGVHFWNSPNRAYIGFWKNGKQNGIAKYKKNGISKFGEWVNGERIKYFDNMLDAISALPSEFLKYDIFLKEETEIFFDTLDRVENI